MSTVVIAGNIKRYREKLDLSKEELGRRIGVSGVTVGYWEQGKTTPRMKNVQQLAEVFGVEWDELLTNGSLGKNEDILEMLPGLNDERKKALSMVLKLSDDDLSFMISILERTLKDG